MKMFKSLFVMLAVITTVSTAQAAEQCTIDVKVNGLVCDFCARALEKTFGKREEVQDISVDLDNGNVRVVLKEGAKMDDATLRQAITDSGYAIDAIERGC